MSRTLLILPAPVTRMMSTVAVLALLASTGQAQFTEGVMSESFDPRADTTGIGVEGGATLTLIAQGGGDNALQFAATSAAGGFFAAGFTISDLETEPGPAGPNVSTNLADYQLSFDLTIADTGFAPNLEIWLGDGPRFASNSANLYTAGGLSAGTHSISFTLDQNLTTTTPNGFPTGTWSPTADDWWIQINSIDFGAPAGAMVDYTIDNIRVSTIPEPTSLLLLGIATTGAPCFARRRRNRI